MANDPVLLSGGNPQIAKGDGDAPVQAYIAAMPSWKQDIGRRLDALIFRLCLAGMLRTHFVHLPMHAGGVFIENLNAIHPHIAAAGVGIMRENHRQRDERAAVLRPAGQHRQTR